MRSYVAQTAIKTFSVGYSPSPQNAFLAFRRKVGLTPENVRNILVKVPSDATGIVGDSAMLDANCRRPVALALVRGKVSLADSHDVAPMNDPSISSRRGKVDVVAGRTLMGPQAPPRSNRRGHLDGRSKSRAADTISARD